MATSQRRHRKSPTVSQASLSTSQPQLGSNCSREGALQRVEKKAVNNSFRLLLLDCNEYLIGGQ
jgi:hypothetical protein